jgi:hypothetical protein
MRISIGFAIWFLIKVLVVLFSTVAAIGAGQVAVKFFLLGFVCYAILNERLKDVEK